MNNYLRLIITKYVSGNTMLYRPVVKKLDTTYLAGLIKKGILVPPCFFCNGETISKAMIKIRPFAGNYTRLRVPDSSLVP